MFPCALMTWAATFPPSLLQIAATLTNQAAKATIFKPFIERSCVKGKTEKSEMSEVASAFLPRSATLALLQRGPPARASRTPWGLRCWLQWWGIHRPCIRERSCRRTHCRTGICPPLTWRRASLVVVHLTDFVEVSIHIWEEPPKEGST